MITTLIICLTVVICLAMVLKWAKDMSTAGLPMFTYGECVQGNDAEEPEQSKESTIGFIVPEEKPVEKKSDKELKDTMMTDPITMFSALLRGEVDIDDVTN